MNRYSLYVPGRSIIHRLDPRTKLAGLGLSFVIVLLFNDPRYLAAVLPVVARRLSGNPAAYDYLAESIAGWPAQPELARRIRAAGWSAVGWQNLTMGVVAVHTARRPDSRPAGVTV